MLPKNLWTRLVACIGVLIIGFLMIKFMHLQEAVITADVAIILIVLSFITYSVIHTFTEHFVVTKK